MTTAMNFTPLLGRALERSLSETDAERAAVALMTGEVPPSQIGSLLAVLRVRGESSREILGFARALRAAATPFPVPDSTACIDTCGTGGDSQGTFNVSTLAGLVVASCGVPVTKHGNRAVSSACGSADLLEGLGLRIDAAPAISRRCLTETGFAFLFAPTFHPVLKRLSPIRRELGFRSIFNLAAPLANPALVRRQVIGVPSLAALLPIAEAVRDLGAEHALVVHGRDGSDEVSLTGGTSAIEIRHGALRAFEIEPRDAGLEPCTLQEIQGGDLGRNLAIATRVLDGEPGSALDFVVLNAAAALVVAGAASSLRDGAVQATEALRSLRTRSLLSRLRRLSEEAA